ncbi:hypothetical protein ACI7YT_08650 [Microbacterium sp. M]|uniref:hypothetical protein n=1 Tax=Microbacterium sp. M TaxID=3377125 RepID=UPI00386AE441
MSFLSTLTASIPGLLVSSIPQVSSDGRHAWVRFHGELGNRVTDDGDLILDLVDLQRTDDLLAEGILDHWAQVNQFSLSGINRTGAFLLLYQKTLHKLLGQMGADDPELDSVRAILDGEESAADNFRVRIDAAFAISVLTDAWDGPFDDEYDFLHAIDRRLAPDAMTRSCD